MPVETQVRLPAEAVSVRRARQHVSEALSAAGRSEWVDDAELAVTEIVANVVLHARTPCDLAVLVAADSVRISVRDSSPQLPTPRHFSRDSTTGRGLALVGRLSADFGVESLGMDGKVVWCVLDGVPRYDESELPGEEWDLTGLLLLDEPAAPVPQVRLAHVPMAIWQAALEYQAAVLRELYLVAAGSSRGSEVTADLAAASKVLNELAGATDRALELAVGDPSLPRVALPQGHPGTLPSVPAVLDVLLPTGTLDGGAVDAFQVALDLGQQLAGAGQLLVRPALDELVALRDWACDQIVAQSAGVLPTPWDSSAGHLTVPDETYRRPEWDDTLVRTSDRAVVAADDSNRLIAVSPAAAALIGVDSEDLIGRRVTSVIPARLREQHVAGFTRHLATGVGRILNVPVDLPLLCADGKEVLRRFLIEQVAAPKGRHVYVAWLDPVPAEPQVLTISPPD